MRCLSSGRRQVEILITDCSDPGMWYWPFKGKTFTMLEDCGDEWLVRDGKGFKNIIRKCDGVLIGVE